MHPAIPIVLIGLLVQWVGEQPPPPLSPQERIVLLPDADGRVGALTITTKSATEVLDRPYAGADVYTDGGVVGVREQAESVAEHFALALEALPPAPVSFIVYFVFDKDELTAESRAQFDRIKAALATRPAPQLVVIGHTDRVGALPYNDALSLQRAQTVRAALIEAGIEAGRIAVAGRGEREPAVETGDEVANERNRRVEIMVR
jgi:outer membrane protein OmpA-like peptidoglycan-associated protein